MAAIVVAPRASLMAPAPDRPAEDVRESRAESPDEAAEEPPDLGNGQRNQVVSSSEPPFFPGQAARARVTTK